MAEPAVALTDYALAVQTAALAMLLQRGRRSALQIWLTVYFASVSMASLCGGTVHGFFPHRTSFAWLTLWSATLLAIGVTALATWFIGAELLRSPRIARLVRIAAVLQLGAYAVVVMFFTKAFWSAIAVNLPAVLFLLTAIVTKYIREPRQPLVLLAGGQALSLVAAIFQQGGFGLHPVHFDHNAVYHIIQGIALYVFYRGATGLLECGRPEQSREIGQLIF